MSTATFDGQPLQNLPTVNGHAPEPPARAPLHRLHAVRQQQGVSLRRVARALKVEPSEVRRQENDQTDLPLSVLYAWQKVLDVPLAELLVESDDPLSAPILERARLLKIMKTTAAIREKADSPALRRLVQMLINQLVEIMPELEDVTPWHVVGQRRRLEEYGAVVERRLSGGVWRDL
ncbi:MAG: helix-turn-helix transcriptional regulator [Pirellulales bacterium]|nr:helix-turn-helix transcriptional regulator [Pirellulales bacterium]